MQTSNDCNEFQFKICFQCWNLLLLSYLREVCEELVTSAEHAQISDLYQKFTNYSNLDITCDFCRCTKLDGTKLITLDGFFRDDEQLEKVDLDSVDLQELFSNKFEQYVNSSNIINKTNDTKVLKGFNFAVLSVHLLRIISLEKRYILGFIKTLVNVNLTLGYRDEFQRKWSDLPESYFNFWNRILASFVADDTNLLVKIQSFISTSNTWHTSHLQNTLRWRYKHVIVDMVVDIARDFKRKYSKLFNYMSSLADDRILFEQLVRIKLNAVFEIDNVCRITDFNITKDVISFVGYYNKYAKGLSQTVWILGKELKSPLSVEECIGIPLEKLSLGSGYKFMASGREDADVRTLGCGRRFCIEVYNCKRDLFDIFRLITAIEKNNPSKGIDMGHLTFPVAFTDFVSHASTTDVSTFKVHSTLPNQDFYFLLDSTAMINNESHVLKVLTCPCTSIGNFFGDLVQDQEIGVSVCFSGLRVAFNNRFERRQVHTCAETHTKTYECLVYSVDAIDFNLLDMNLTFPIEILQKNPIRSSHRRSQQTRRRTIYSLKIQPIHPRLFILNLTTQAGTYIKEFVTGDLGRTRPSLGDILHCKQLHVLQLDVTGFG
ncbi:bifunctional Pseudouridine synthase [Babesia duncani]|uniref:tRNA pseudouridine(55) synthase n=1 Tax=Babesia duncani TaxID=323732 RepID=A0AAD9PMP8_9APIC|nr:bifunctional Pseudouridine synthase [Babesia duncani]